MKSLDNFDKSLEERFDPKNKIIGESQLKEFDLQKKHKQTSKFFQIEFSSSIPEDTKLFLSKKIPVILDFPSKFGLQVFHANNLLRFLDKETYESEMERPLPKNITLPASRIEIKNSKRDSIITIIIPKKIDSAEIVVNITRNIFSKLCGKIFFNEKILPLEFFRHSKQVKKQIMTGIPEILDLIDEIHLSSKIFKSYCESLGESYKHNSEKDNSKISKQVISEWRKKCERKSLPSKEINIIESIFREFIVIFKLNSNKIYKYFIKRINQLNLELNFILPHESRTYKNLEKNRSIHFIRVVYDKLEEIYSLLGFLEELDSLMKKPQNIDDLNILAKLIRSRMKQMKKEKKVFHFYNPGRKNKSEIKKNMGKYKLDLIKMLPKGTPLQEWSREVKKLENNYSVSIYAKIYSTLGSFYDLILASQENKNENFLKTEKGQNLKKLLPILKYRTNSIRKLKSNLGLILDINEQISIEFISKNSPHLIPLNDFGKAWSYFISSVLTMLFYKEHSEFERLPQVFRPDNYLKSILDFIEKQCKLGINHFHIVKLLWLLYEKVEKDALEFVIFCIQNPNNFLRFALHQLMLPEVENNNLDNRINKLPKYRDSLFSLYSNRFNENKK